MYSPPSVHAEGGPNALSSTLIVAASALLLAALTAHLSTERAQPRLNPSLGWPLTVALFIFAVVTSTRHLGTAVAVAVALAGLMVAIPGVSAWMGWRQGLKNAHHGT